MLIKNKYTAEVYTVIINLIDEEISIAGEELEKLKNYHQATSDMVKLALEILCLTNLKFEI